MNGIYITKLLSMLVCLLIQMKLIIALYIALWFFNLLLPISVTTQFEHENHSPTEDGYLAEKVGLQLLTVFCFITRNG